MIPKGIENAEAIVEACRQTLASLDSEKTEWREVLEEVIQKIS